MQREGWGTRIGVILAVAGSALGLGNFLRFPAKAALNGGGAFMIPYFVALLLLGIPLCWLEWSLGRFGGQRGHGTAPGTFSLIAPSPAVKYLGTIGLVAPFIILAYYLYIESWTLAYAWYSFSGVLFSNTDQHSFKDFLAGHQGLNGAGFSSAYGWFLAAFVINFYFIFKGLRGGIEKLSRIAMPVLVLLAVLLTVRVLTLGTPDPARPELSINNALGFFWNPDLSMLFNARVWLEAAGQIFFTLSVGIGAIMTYASYTKKEDDLLGSGLMAASANEFCEVILGGSLIIPAAFVFFGAAGTVEIAESGLFNIGFVSMPLVFTKIHLGALFAGLWFLLLFLAGITSSVSLLQPLMAFMQDEMHASRRRAGSVLAVLTFICCQPCIFFLGHGFVDELDFWGGTFLLVVFATIEVILFVWVHGLDNVWMEMHQGAKMRLPRIFRFVFKYVTPAYLLILLGAWTWQDLLPVLSMERVAPADQPYIWGARVLILGLFLLCILAVRRVAHRFQYGKERLPEAVELGEVEA